MRNLLVLLVFLANSISVQAAEKDTVTVRATLQTLSVQVVGNDIWDMGLVAPRSVITMTAEQRFVVKNNGNGKTTFTLQITDTGGIWKASSTEDAVGQDKFVLSGVFTAISDTGIVEGEFNTGTNDDVIKSTAPKTATDTIYASPNATANGVNVPPNEERTLWLQFKSPTSSTTTDTQSIVITIGAVP